MQGARAAERERQRRRRAGLRAEGATAMAGPATPTEVGHAPASAAMLAEAKEKVLRSVDEAFDVSRAAFQRLVPTILGDLARSMAKAGTESRP